MSAAEDFNQHLPEVLPWHLMLLAPQPPTGSDRGDSSSGGSSVPLPSSQSGDTSANSTGSSSGSGADGNLQLVLEQLLLWLEMTNGVVQGGERGEWKAAESLSFWKAVYAGLQPDAPAGLAALAARNRDLLARMWRIGYACQFDKCFWRVRLLHPFSICVSALHTTGSEPA